MIKSQGQKYMALLDTGAAINCINENIVQKNKLYTYTYPTPIDVGMAVEGNKIQITKYVELPYKIGQFSNKIKLAVLPAISQFDIILGLPWIRKINPLVPNWTTGDMFITKMKVNGKPTTYKIRAVHTEPYSHSLNKPVTVTPPTQAQLNRLCKNKSVEIYYILVKNSEIQAMPINSLAMQKAAEEAIAFAEQSEQFDIPSFEEPPLYKESEPHTQEQKVIIDKIISDHSEVLRKTIPPGLPPKRKGDGPIAPTTPGTIPSNRAPYKLSPSENMEVKRQLEEYINKGYLVPTDSPWGAPVFLVKKSHSPKLRLVCDWRALNKATIKNKFAIPHPEILMDKLNGAKYFTKIDLSQGFHQLRLCEEDRKKSAITTRYGNFEWTVAAFGMANVPSVFSRVVGDVLWEYQDKFVINFMDDILIYSPDFNTHQDHLHQVLNKLEEAELYANPDKCTWFATSVHYLGHEISAEGIRVSKEKIKAIQEWPTPKNIKELRSFLGLASFYRKHIKRFAFIAEPLYVLLAKDKKWRWNGDHKKALSTLKDCLSNAPVLLFPDFTKPFTLCPDSSGYAIGGVLLQDQGYGLQPIAYESRKMVQAERNYPVHEQELLAILHCLKKWRHYILNQPTIVATDHAPLKYLETQPHLSARQARWLDFLSQYDLNISPQPGKENLVADSLSRRPDHIHQMWHIYHASNIYAVNVLCTSSLSNRVLETFDYTINNTDITERLSINAVNIWSQTSSHTVSEDNLLLAIKKAYNRDIFIKPLLNKVVKNIKTAHGSYVLVNDIIYYVTQDSRYLVYIPASAKLEDSKISLQQTIIQECHDALYAGHYGSAKTTLRVQQQFHWPGIHKDIAIYCNTCVSCKRNKPSNRKPPGLLQPLEIPFKPWSVVSVDFITHLPKTVDGYDCIMVVVDKFSKRAHFVPTTSEATAETTAHLFFNTVWRAHGLPSKIISDRDSKFTSQFWQTLWRLLGTRLAMSTAFSPQTDGQTERINRTLEEYIRNYIDVMHKNWAQLLAPAEYAYNSAPILALDNKSPFQIDTGQQPNDPLFLFGSAARFHARENRVINTVDDYMQQFATLRARARNALQTAQENIKTYYDTTHRQEEFKVGDRVYLSTKRHADYGAVLYPSHGPASVFEPRYLGPFKIIRKISSHAYELELPKSFKIHPVIHIRYLLKHSEATKYASRILVPEPEVIMDDGSIEYEVESILKHRVRKYGRGSRLEYLVHWKGYASHEDTWEPIANLDNCIELVQDYHRMVQIPQPVLHSIYVISVEPMD